MRYGRGDTRPGMTAPNNSKVTMVAITEKGSRKLILFRVTGDSVGLAQTKY